MDLDKVDRFWKSRQSIADPRKATNYRDDGRLVYDVELVSKFFKPGWRYLDLGAGTGTMCSHFVARSSQTVAVEKWAGLLSQIPHHEKLRKIKADILDFCISGTFDCITLFGVMNFVPAWQENELLENCRSILRDNGVFIVKHQCGVKAEVVIDNFSEDLGTWYHARYPHWEEERDRMAAFFHVDVVDIYPPELNRWEDTRFFAFVCRPTGDT